MLQRCLSALIIVVTSVTGHYAGAQEWTPSDSVKVCVGLKPGAAKIMFVVPRFFTAQDCKTLITGNPKGTPFPSPGDLNYQAYFMCYKTGGAMGMGPQDSAPDPQFNTCGWS